MNTPTTADLAAAILAAREAREAFDYADLNGDDDDMRYTERQWHEALHEAEELAEAALKAEEVGNVWTTDKPTEPGLYLDRLDIDPDDVQPIEIVACKCGLCALEDGEHEPVKDRYCGRRERLGPFTADDVLRGMLTRDPGELLKMLALTVSGGEDARNVIQSAVAKALAEEALKTEETGNVDSHRG